MRRFPSLLLAGLATSTLVACADDLPQEGLIVSTRLLAIRAEVTVPLMPEMDAETAKAQALPFETVHVTPFVVGPEGPIDPATLNPIWIVCEMAPGQGLFGCISDTFPIALDELEECPVPSFEDLEGDDLPVYPSPCFLGETGEPDWVAPMSESIFIGGAFELTMISGTGEGRSAQECARPFLEGEYQLPDDCLYAVQRLTIGPLEQLLLLAEEFGFELPGGEAPDPEDIPDADRNPRISGFEVSVLDDEGEPGDKTQVDDGETYQASVGDTLRIDVTSPEEDLQTYLIAVNNGESFDETDERYDGRWFRTWGSMLSDFSDDPESYNEWAIDPGSQDESETPPDDQAWLYYVVRDGRAGVAWQSIRLEVVEP